ncbi:unnamed protein product [Prunus armeniaca]|uniref:Uncharacterized protein n=1 Tax=Prunus armeniaca TaxID=36596 RepID=A0A6J5XPM8_PRUAR|nr:hypothetical protein GBA52_020378 [Prunus armeniaca]CAB4313895.1 unnamed protein product [Prunus armeniaca]
MPAPVNYSGDDDFYHAVFFYSNPMNWDLGCLLSIGSHGYYPSSKRAHISSIHKVDLCKSPTADKVIQPLKLDNSYDTLTTGEEDKNWKMMLPHEVFGKEENNG